LDETGPEICDAIVLEQILAVESRYEVTTKFSFPIHSSNFLINLR